MQSRATLLRMHAARTWGARPRCTAAVVGLMVMAGCAAPVPPPDGALVSEWLRRTLAIARAERLGAPLASRISAYAALALHEGYASDPASGTRSLAASVRGLGQLPAVSAAPVDGAVVAAEAVRGVLDSLLRDGLPETRRAVDALAAAQAAQREAAGVPAGTVRASRAHGRAVAGAILAWAATDGFAETRGVAWAPTGRRGEWTNTAEIGQYVPQQLSGHADLVSFGNPDLRADPEAATARGTFTNRPKAGGRTTLPAFSPVRPTEPYWGRLRPFVLLDADTCAPPAPPPYSEVPGSPFWAMGRAFLDSVAQLTPDQRTIALFWADNPVATGTPGFHWISVVAQMVARRRVSAPAAAELAALTSMAIADAFIGCWREKYRSNVVRPVTYVRRVFDPAFATVIPTPPFPEYPSGHSVQSAAAVTVLAAILGDSIPFEDSTQVDLGHPPRRFANFSAALDEVSRSRVYAGVHYWPAVTQGLIQGRCIGTAVLRAWRTAAPR